MVMRRQRMPEDTRKRVVDELRLVVGEDDCSDNPTVPASYSLYPLVIPEVAVIVESVEQVQGVLRVANAYRVPVTPLAAATVSLSTGVFVPGAIGL